VPSGIRSIVLSGDREVAPPETKQLTMLAQPATAAGARNSQRRDSMPSLFRHTHCPACGHRHHFSLVTGETTAGREYDYVCPESGKPATLRPTSLAEIVPFPPQGAVELSAAAYEPSRASQPEPAPDRPAAPVRAGSLAPAAAASKLNKIESEVHELVARVDDLEQKSTTAEPPRPPADVETGAAEPDEPEAGPTRLQEVLPKVKDLAGKVGGLDHLSDIVDTLKESKKE
jgi:outer membrane murein-binding lipoprotein Lpp